MKILTIVRRFGHVGGMESYVVETTLALRDLGHQVEVLCEKCFTEPPHGVLVHEIGQVARRPRWLALWRFGRNAKAWLERNPRTDWLIHSHERLDCHHVTTFHGQPFATIFEKHWSRLVSIRVWMHLMMERRELAVAQTIIPVSQRTKELLSHYYPKFAHKLAQPIVPGVRSRVTPGSRVIPPDGGVIGFIGKEWKRKGLQRTIEIVQRLRETRPKLQLLVFGPDRREIEHLFSGWQKGFELLGWVDHVPYENIDVLLHPALAEPYGMAIAEAMAAQVPVVISDQCGVSAQVEPGSGTVISIQQGVDRWVESVDQQLARDRLVPAYVREWKQVAQEQLKLYRAVLAATPVRNQLDNGLISRFE